MSLLSRLLGRGSGGSGGSGPGGSGPEPEEHAGFRIYAEPIKETGGHRVAGRIEKDIDGQTRRHDFVRADVCQSFDDARRISLAKARQVIDEQGEGMFS